MRRLRRLAEGHPVLAAWLVFFSLGAILAGPQPWTDDARFYVPAAAAYGTWLEQAALGAVTLDASAFSRGRLDAAFGVNREHPPVAKYVMSLGWLAFHRWTGLLDEVAACRVGIAALWAWACALVWRMVRARLSRAAAFVAAVGLATMPRFLFHGHVETLDLAVAAFLVATFDALLRYLETPSWRTGALTVLYFALALGAKLNAPFFAGAALLFVVLADPPRRRDTELVLAPLPLALVGMLAVSPLLTVAAWPWLWFDTLARLNAYALFHLQHYGILFYFRGTLYGDTPAPWSAPWLMTALTVPLPLFVLGVWGAALAARALWRRTSSRLPRFADAEALREPAARMGALALMQALAQLVAVSLPGVPVYGGVKLFLPAFPFLAILAGWAFAQIERELGREALAPARRAALVWGTAALVLLPGLLGAAAYRGALLSYYNELAGGLRGATRAGFERQYYDLAYAEIGEALARHLPQGGAVAVLPNPKEYGPHFQRWRAMGLLDRRVRLTSPEEADVLLLTHERRWREYPALAARYRVHPRLETFAVAGVPLFTLYDLRD